MTSDTYEKECQKLYVDYYSFDFTSLPLIKGDLFDSFDSFDSFEDLNHLIYGDLLYIKDTFCKEESIWQIKGDNEEIPLLWINNTWCPDLSYKDKRNIINTHLQCIEDYKTVLQIIGEVMAELYFKRQEPLTSTNFTNQLTSKLKQK